MKVLMVVSWYGNRGEKVMSAGVFHYEQAMALKDHCDTALYFPFDPQLPVKFSRRIENGLLTYRRRLKRSRLPKLEGVREILRTMRDLWRICREYHPDVIHAHCALPAGRAAVLFGKLFGYPVVVTEHNPLEMMRMESPWARWQTGFVYRSSKANICVSKNSAERLRKIFPGMNFRVIFNGIIDPCTLETDGKTYAVPGKINSYIVGAFYNQKVKGYQYLLPAVAELKKQGIDMMLHICGGGTYMEEYQEMARELGIAENCIFYGQIGREQIYSLMAQMDFGISSSLYESAGLTVEEAMLMGKPLVVTRSGGANSLVTEEAAIVVERGSTEALVDGIKQMIQRLQDFDPAAIRRYAFQNFDIRQVSKQHVRLYRKIVGKKK